MRPRFQGCARVGPCNRCRGVLGIIEAAQIALGGEVSQLVFRPARIGEVAVEQAGLGADGLDDPRGDIGCVTGGTLGDVGHDVGEGLICAVLARQRQRDHRTNSVQDRLGLGLVPQIGEGGPALGPVDQQPGLDHADLLQIQAFAVVDHGLIGLLQHPPAAACLVEEGLGDDRPDRKGQGVVARLVVRRGAQRHPEGSQLLRMVGEQRRGQIIGRHALAQDQGVAGHLDHAPVPQGLRVFGGEIGRIDQGLGRRRRPGAGRRPAPGKG
ncbi:hypothetical protein D3C75_790340 [compost metagenome]